jgi:WD40 repeat protein
MDGGVAMGLPNSDEYQRLIQNPKLCFGDSDLKQGRPLLWEKRPLPRAFTGNFADVYKIEGPGQDAWAVKCFTREVADLQQRYKAISEFLHAAKQKAALPFMVDFDYLESGIRVSGHRWAPILKMQWVEGELLNSFVKRFLTKPETLTALAEIWLHLARDLRSARLAHGDLQHGNVLLVTTDRGTLVPTLIDYDGMFVPSLAGKSANELGHPNYQHPRRADDPFHADIDRFSHLVIYTAIRCLVVAGAGLWSRYENDDNLLFKETDLKDPGDSELFRELWKVSDADAHALVGRLVLAAVAPPRQTPILDDLVHGSTIIRLSLDQEKRLDKLLSPKWKPPVKAAPKNTWIPHTSPPATGWAAPPLVTSTKTPILWSGGALPVQSNPPKGAFSLGSPPRAPQSGPSPGDTGTSARSLNYLRNVFFYLMILGIAALGITGITSLGRMVSGDDRKTVILQGHARQITSLAFSPDGRRIVSCSADQNVKLWDASAGQEIRTLHQPDERDVLFQSIVSFSPDGKRIIGCLYSAILVWDADAGEGLPLSLKGHDGQIHCMAIRSDGRRIASGGWGGIVKVWDAHTGQDLRTYIGHADNRTSAVTSVSFSPDGQRIASGDGAGVVKVWDADTGKEIVVNQNNVPVTSVLFSPDGRRIVIFRDPSPEDRQQGPTTIVCDANTGEELEFLSFTSVGRPCFSRDGQKIIGHSFNSIRVWDVNASKEIQYSGSLEDRELVHCFAASPDGKRIASGFNHIIRIWAAWW